MIYAWHEAKKKRPQHILDVDGRTFCQLENIKRRKKFRPLSEQSDTPAPDRVICRNCEAIVAQREPDLAVLMGEQMA